MRLDRCFGLLALCAVVALAACSTKNQGLTPSPDQLSREGFFVTTEQGEGNYTPLLEVAENGSEVVVNVLATNAEDLRDAFMHLSYDSTSLTPSRVELGEFLGDETQIISLALTDVSGEVPIGISQIRSSGVQARSGDGQLAKVYFTSGSISQARQTSQSPSGDVNKVNDLLVIDQDATSVTLQWTERNIGDYNNDSEVGIADLTPVGVLFGQAVATAEDPIWAALVDGDGNSEINIADVTPIGSNYGNVCDGYIIYTDVDSEEPVSAGVSVYRTDFFVSAKRPVEYQYTATLSVGDPPSFTVRAVQETDISNPGPPSNQAQVAVEPGPPAAPTGLTAETGESIGHRSVQLSWTKSTSPDVSAYEIERKLASENDSAWQQIVEVSRTASGYVDNDDTLIEESYDYRVRARDFTDEYSDYCPVASATPWFQPKPSPPEGLSAQPHPTQGEAILLTWNPPGDASAIKFEIWRKPDLGGMDQFGLIKTTQTADDTEHTDSGLVQSQTYEYYLYSIGLGGVNSDPTATVSSQPSIMVEINITSFTADKWTHCTDGSEPAVNLAVTTDETPDSYEWTSTLGNVTGSGANVTWSAPAGSTAQKVTITCTVHLGTGSDSDSINQFVTEYPIDTNGDHTGVFFEVDGFESVQTPNPPYMKMSELFEGEGHAVICSQWGLWCGYCLLEMPDFQEYMDWWGDDGLYATGVDHWDSLADVTTWFNDNDCPDLDTWIVNTTTAQAWFNWHDFSYLGSSFGSAPMNVIYDRDGNTRWVKRGSLTYNDDTREKCEKMLSQLIGEPIP